MATKGSRSSLGSEVSGLGVFGLLSGLSVGLEIKLSAVVSKGTEVGRGEAKKGELTKDGV